MMCFPTSDNTLSGIYEVTNRESRAWLGNEKMFVIESAMERGDTIVASSHNRILRSFWNPVSSNKRENSFARVLCDLSKDGADGFETQGHSASFITVFTGWVSSSWSFTRLD